MIAVIFEVQPHKNKEQDYFEIAARLNSELQAINGFISVERFESVNSPGKFLSLSFWENENAVSEWRNTKNHRSAQQKGREQIFENYRIRVASIIRDYEINSRLTAPEDSNKYHK